MEFDDLPSEAQEAFEEAQEAFEGSVDEAAKTQYIDGLQRAVNNDKYAGGLADRFNMDAEDFSGVTGLWEDAVAEADADDWESALTEAGISEKFRNRLVVGLTESGN